MLCYPLDLTGKHLFWPWKKNVVTVNLIYVKITKELKKNGALVKLLSVAGETFAFKNKKCSNDKNLMLVQLLYFLVTQENETPIAVGVMSIDLNVFFHMK